MYEQQLDRLIVRISGGDDDALAELYEKTNRGVFAFLYSYLDNREDSEDAMQDVYLKVKLHAGSYRHGSNARAWMLQIAKNIALNERGRARWTRIFRAWRRATTATASSASRSL